MLKVIGVPFIVYAAEPEDADLLVNIRVQSMRESLEALGRFDPDRARERFLNNFVCEDTFKLVSGQQILGFYLLRDRKDYIWLDHLYVHPSAQGGGIGAAVISRIKAHAFSKRKPIRLGALKQSKANAFYQRHGFQHTHSAEFDNYYELPLESMPQGAPTFILKRAEPKDIEQLADLRHEAMKDEWAANNLTDYALARRHFFEDFKSEATLKIVQNEELLGFTAVHEYQDYIHLDMIYLHPTTQGQGIGGQIVTNIKEQATQLNKPIRLGALRISNSNKFYLAQGFNFTHNVDFNNYYEFTPEPAFQLQSASQEDFEELQHIRYTAMKESAEANGLFHHDEAREIFLSEYAPEKTRKIQKSGKTVGFYVVLNHLDHLYLDMFYLLPEAQGLGIGSKVLQQIKDQADEQNKPIRLDALRISRANDFYQGYGFRVTHSEGSINYYEYAPKCSLEVSEA
ncbi:MULTISPECIES: GNAT family N-acetyltransferase [unclassified Pseudovibrio]|uniref:GNAT family N-acetyltransferase n=1 Tax=unclassified Pseudovibrio TaxID=2627060 RepID=UPI0007B2E277|nr:MULTISPECIES: GNAT family N-acetyltransferase [unclassified Pseudovibrio]KZL03480.1 putative acetyltransferase [Pseudovibrio sp. W74]KZL10182.1 putative acetyltransferase [Pseudovibrio sp. Ad14]